MPGYTATNIDRNVNIPHAVSFFFLRSGDSAYKDVGDVADISVNVDATFLEHNSYRAGKNALAKRLLQQRGVSIGMSLNEINPNNLRYVWLAGAEATGSINVQETATPSRTAAGTFVLPDTPAEIIAVTSEDGTTTYAGSGTDYTDSGGGVLTIATSSNLDTNSPNEGDKIHVHYTVAFSGSDTTVIEIMNDTSISGAGQFKIRNSEGGLAQVLVLDSVNMGPNGEVAVPPDAIQTLPLLVSAQVLNGLLGRMYLRDVA